MKNNLTCEIVEDLMPSYIDGLTSEVTNKAVREHLSQCDKCKNKLDTMSEPCSEDKIEQEKKEIGLSIEVGADVVSSYLWRGQNLGGIFVKFTTVLLRCLQFCASYFIIYQSAPDVGCCC